MFANGTRPSFEILYVDDEEKALQYFREIFEDDYTIHTAANAMQGYEILAARGAAVGVLVTDQRMPGGSGVELMEQARKLNPNLVRILVTAYTDYQAAVDAVNEGRAFRYLHKPWDPEELGSVLRHAMDYYTALTEREQLLAEKAETIRTMLTADKVAGMGILAEGLNHHLRNALTVVRAFIDLAPMKLMEEIECRPPRDAGFWVEVQGQAAAQIERIQGLLMRIAEASHARKLPRNDAVQLEAVLREALSVFSTQLMEKHLQVDIQIDPRLPVLLVHAERFCQLWRLLLMEEVSHLTPNDHLHIHATVEDDHLGHPAAVITVRDSGPWLEHDRAANIFDPFFARSRRPDDFGVNMMACYVTMHLHGGTMEARNLKPTGLELVMRLPLDPAAPMKDDALADPQRDYFTRILQHEQRWRTREDIPA